METQEISAPVERLTREAPKRQAGYGLPCAKCHKYFPADLEVCPICKGRERVSPIVAPKIKKPVQSETSVATSSTNVALKQDVKESPKPESPALAPPVEIKLKDELVAVKNSIPTPVVAERQVASEARASVVSKPPVVTLREKESPKSESPAVVVPVEVKVKDQPLNKKQPLKIPAVVELPVPAESAPARLASMHTVLTPKEGQSPQLEFPVVAPPVEINAKDEPLDHREPITGLVVAEIPATIEQAPTTLVSTQPVLTQPVSTQKEKPSPTSESPAMVPPVEIKVKDQPLDQKESITMPVAAAVVEPVSTQIEKKSPKSESPAVPASAEIKVKAQIVEQKELSPIPVVQLSAAVEPPLSSLISIPKAAESLKLESPTVARLSDQRNDDLHQQEPMTTAALVEAHASDPLPAVVAAQPEEKERSNESKPPSADLPTTVDTEEHRRDKINQALRIVIPMLVENQVSEAAPVAAKQELLEQETKEQAPKISEVAISASEVKVVEEKVVKAKIAEEKSAQAKPVEIRTVQSPAILDMANRRPDEEEPRKIETVSNAAPQPSDLNAPLVMHLNLGELRPPRTAPNSALAPTQLKEIKSGESEPSPAGVASNADTSESPAPAGGRKLDLVTFALGVVVLACAVLLITLAAIRLMPHNASEPVRRAKPAYSSAPTADRDANVLVLTSPPTASAVVNSASSDSSSVVAPNPVPAQPPAAFATKPPSTAGSGQVLTLPEGLAEGNLLYRVEPDYPEEARRQGVQGPVVLDLHIGKDGLVQGVDLVSGQPLLAQAATTAVKQWRFRTRYVNGNEVEMQARITLHFALPAE